MDLRLLRYFVAVAEERHFGRAAARLFIAQPSLSRAIRVLERDLGATLLERSSGGVATTPAGALLLDEARLLLERADHLRVRVAAVGGDAVITLGSLAGAVEHAGPALVSAFRSRHPDVRVDVRESDFSDPTCGLRAGLVDLAVTLAPFDTTGLAVQVLRTDPVEVVLRADDPLAGRSAVTSEDLADRPWFRMPPGADPVWSAFWGGGRGGPVVHTAHECLQAVLWNGSVGLVPAGHDVPAGLVTVPLRDHPPAELIVAWDPRRAGPLVRSFLAGVVAEERPAGRVEGGSARSTSG
ncbi:LysR family transcriptional regulator [Actinomycetospora sp. CA-084318]|uniref:LysR family transcriptional regulator n=1 Tax=Actinomycetospora sp. CA-084318 TaxID=3239892 RepID=UPI003D9A073F